MISLLVAMDRQNIIGADGDLPWKLPNDLKFFKEKTTGHTIIMGRKTYESIGRPLPNRRSVVISRQHNNFPDGVDVINSIETVKEWNRQNPAEELFVIGGGHIFEQVLPFSDRMYITLIDKDFKGDTYFPDFSDREWTLTESIKGEKNEKNPYDYYFQQYDRK